MTDKSETNYKLGINLKYKHFDEFLALRPNIDYVEVHSENFFDLKGIDYDKLLKIKEHYPISLHSIGNSLGSSHGIDIEHVKRLKLLGERINAFLISDHLSWNANTQYKLPDLLPAKLNKESFEVFRVNIDKAQQILDQKILIENPSTYLKYKGDEIYEPDFLNDLCLKTGCGILLDVNNIYVSSYNNGFSSQKYLESIDANYVKEIHLAGHSEITLKSGKALKLDTHSAKVIPEVWDLYEMALKNIHTIGLQNNIYTTLEWDSDVPSLDILLLEINKSQEFIPKIIPMQARK